ncbi:response regulator transcription factor [Azovibrio restrictus]|uniref:response regulator n=1 Tax=Azovibrio restrictus TaxID=146938 RepID=UPI0026E98328|nr:response regulator transcription factor [Azovibrio restrictus]MDD3483449.1 response regulator transcription factor [Azovibrio restrictus]
MDTITILLADDQLLVRAGIRALLESQPGHQVVAECENGMEAVAAIETLKPSVAVLDIAMPGMSGIEVAQRVRNFDADVKILVLSGIERQEVVEQALAAGVNGYMLKDFAMAELQLALETVLRHGRFLSPKLQERLISRMLEGGPAGAVSLTTRQTEILRLVASGKTTKEIARELDISPKTVEFHRAQLMEKLGVHDVTGLTRYAMQNGLVH